MSGLIVPDYWQKGLSALKKKDKVLSSLIDSYHGEQLTLRGDSFYTLARSIAGQQISVKAAASIWQRLEQELGSITPEIIANAQSTRLRACGFSNSKVLYLHALANHFLENPHAISHWPQMDDEAIIKELTSIKGIGRWSAEMFLIFGLGRPDVFPVADLGLLKGIYRHYYKGEKVPLTEIRAIGERWRPWRSVGTWYMWRALDPLPVVY